MAYYIKVRKETAEALGVADFRNETADGCVLLWQADANRSGIYSLTEAVAAIGGVLLTPVQARAEMDGTEKRSLPTATDPRYYVPEVNEEPTDDETPEIPGTTPEVEIDNPEEEDLPIDDGDVAIDNVEDDEPVEGVEE